MKEDRFPSMHICCSYRLCVLLGLWIENHIVFHCMNSFCLFCLCNLKLKKRNHKNFLSFFLPSLFSSSRPDIWLMFMCADFLQKTKGLTQCLKILSQLRWLALRPLVQMNHQTTILALKGWDQTQWAALCRVSSHLHPHPCVTPQYRLFNPIILILWLMFSFLKALHLSIL